MANAAVSSQWSEKLRQSSKHKELIKNTIDLFYCKGNARLSLVWGQIQLNGKYTLSLYICRWNQHLQRARWEAPGPAGLTCSCELQGHGVKSNKFGDELVDLTEWSKAKVALIKKSWTLLKGSGPSPPGGGGKALRGVVVCVQVRSSCTCAPFIYPSASLHIAFSHSFHPDRFPFFHLFFHLASSSSHLSSSSLPASLHLLDISLSPFHIPPPPLLPPLSLVMNESVCWVQFIFTEQGSAPCQSLSHSTSLSLD